MLIAIAVICVLIEALFTCLEVAFSAVSRARLRGLLDLAHDQDRSTKAEQNGGASDHSYGEAASSGTVSRKTEIRAARTLRLLEQPERLTLLFITVTSLTLWTSAGVLTWHAISEDWPTGVLVISFALVLFVAEVLPLLIAARNPEAMALLLSGVASRTSRLLSPLLFVLGAIGRGAARLLGAGTNLTTQVTEGELRTALAAAEEEGVIESDERAMLEGAITFREKKVQEVMTPRIDIVGVPSDAPLQEVLAVSMREGHSRIPVYEGTVDKIIGVVATKDLIPHLRKPESSSTLCALDVARQPFFVPPTKRIAPTLEELKRQRSLIAIVVDADGGTAGLVTLEDLLEEIVGEIQDEYDDEEPPLRVLDERQLIASSLEESVSLHSEPLASNPSTQNGSAGAGIANGTSSNLTTSSEQGTGFAVICDASTSVRETTTFWRKQWGAMLRLRDIDGDLAEGGLSLAALALRLFDGVPSAGDTVMAGTALPGAGRLSSDEAGELGRAEAARFDSELSIEMEVQKMSGPRIETLILRGLSFDEAAGSDI